MNQLILTFLLAAALFLAAFVWVFLDPALSIDIIAVCQNVPGGDVCRISF